MKNILVVVGSGQKKGNTNQLAEAFVEGATSAGHTLTKVFLGDKTINGCNGCEACRTLKRCTQKDDMESIYPLIHAADTIVLASPLYFWTISARLKAFLERFYAIAELDDNPPKGRYENYEKKDCALLMTAADDLFWTFEQAVSYYQFNCINYLGWNDKGMLLAGGCGGSQTKKKIAETEHLERARNFGKNMYIEFHDLSCKP